MTAVEIHYIAIARSGDLPGMAGHTVTMPVTTKKALRLWRNFNRLHNIFHVAFSCRWLYGAPKKECEILQRNALDAFFAASRELGEYYGEEWTKWHARTDWVVKPNKKGFNQ